MTISSTFTLSPSSSSSGLMISRIRNSNTVPAVPRPAWQDRFRDKVLIPRISVKALGACKALSSCSVASQTSLPILPKSLNEYPFGKRFSALTSVFGHQDALSHGVPKLSKLRKPLKPLKAYKNDLFSFKPPVSDEKPEWWWRTLACIPYLIATQTSDVAYYLQPLLNRYDFFGDLVYFVPGAITRLPAWFIMAYIYLAYVGIVKNKDWPYFFRYHLMLGMLLETSLQLVWYASNFMPLIHYSGKLGMYYWAGVALAYICVLLQCVGCALAGGYAHVPFISDAAYIHTTFNTGGLQRPF